MEHPEHPEEALRPNTGEPVTEEDWMDVGCGVEGEVGWGGVGWGVDRVPLCWPDYALNRMSSHNKGFIITSWRVAAVWELRAAAFSARRPRNVAQLRSAREVQTTTSPVWVSLSRSTYKAASVSGHQEKKVAMKEHSPPTSQAHALLFSSPSLSSRYNTYCL